MKVAEKIRHNLKEMNLPHEASQISDQVTLSLGVTGCIPDKKIPMTVLVEQADLGLYKAKKAGRDCAVAKTMHLM